MKSFLKAIILCLLLPAASGAQHADTVIQGVKIVFSYSPENFPETWRLAPVNADGEEIAPYEVERTKLVMIRTLSKYSDQLLGYNLKAVYFLKSMRFFNVGYGGTNATDALFMTNNGYSMGYTDRYIEQTFHHEFSSILFRNYNLILDTIAWKKANDPTFDYNDPESGVGAIRTGRSSQLLDTVLSKYGFLTEYSMSSLENDINTLAQNLFLPDAGFWSIFDKYPKIKTKTGFLILFYNKLDERYTERYFRNFDH
jgi:hypothetical protein